MNHMIALCSSSFYKYVKNQSSFYMLLSGKYDGTLVFPTEMLTWKKTNTTKIGVDGPERKLPLIYVLFVDIYFWRI